MINSKLPQLKLCRSKEVTFESPTQRPRMNTIIARVNRSPQPHRQTTLKHSTNFNQVSSKINTNIKKLSSSVEYPDIKFQSVKWSGNSTLHPGFFNLPSISKHNFVLSPASADPEISAVNSNNHSKDFAVIEETMGSHHQRYNKKFAKVSSPWRFQQISYITPNQD